VVDAVVRRLLVIAATLLLGSASSKLWAQDFPDEKPAATATSKTMPAATTPTQPKAAPEKPKTPPRTAPRKSTPEPVVLRIPSARATPATPTDAAASTPPVNARSGDAAAASGGSPTPQLGAPDQASTPSFVSALEAVPRDTGPLQLLGEIIESGSRHELRWASSQSFDGAVVTTPVIVLHGVKPGPRLCMTAAVHGDELNGIEIIRRVTNEIDVAELAGTVIAVPIVNYLGYSRASRYLPDRRDLNRYFPGTRTGSSASRIAFGFFNDIARHCHALVDFHTGSFDRSNLPQVRGDLRGAAVLAFTREFGATAVLHSPGSSGMLRRALTDVGIPAITFEVGSPLRLEPSEIDFGVQAMHTLMHKMGMTRSFRMWAEPQALFYAAKWVRADSGGMLFSEVKLGDRVRAGQRLGKVIDPIQNLERAIVSPVRGKVLGMALNQIVLPGFAAYHLGVETSEQRMAEEAARAAASTEGGPPGIDDPAEDDGAGTPIERAPEDEDSER
jgi:predicted deacylase